MVFVVLLVVMSVNLGLTAVAFADDPPPIQEGTEILLRKGAEDPGPPVPPDPDTDPVSEDDDRAEKQTLKPRTGEEQGYLTLMFFAASSFACFGGIRAFRYQEVKRG